MPACSDTQQALADTADTQHFEQRACMQAPVLLSLTVQCYKLYFAMGSVFLMKDLHLQLKEF